MSNPLLFTRAEPTADLRPAAPETAPERPCQGCESSLSQLGYLADLVDYAASTLRKEGAPIDAAFLARRFCQPFGALEVSCAEVDARVSRARLAVEVLRRFLAGLATPADEGDVARASLRYCQIAYPELLRRLGTSFDEIRVARGAKPDVRAALAARLGIDLGPTRPDALDQLFLDPAALTEQQIEETFGLPRTDVEPVGRPPREPSKLERWRKARLRALWRCEDRPHVCEAVVEPPPGPGSGGTGSKSGARPKPRISARPAPPSLRPIVDPYRIGGDATRSARDYFRHPTVDDVAFALYTARLKEVDAIFEALGAAAAGASTDLEALDRVVQKGLGIPVSELRKIADGAEGAAEAREDLVKRGVSARTLHLLVRVCRIAAAQPAGAPRGVLATEWFAVVDALTEIGERALFARWIDEEEAKHLLLGPDAFQVPPPVVTSRLPGTEPIAFFAANPEAHAAWIKTLEARIDDEKAALQEIADAVAAAERLALPHLVAVLVNAIRGALFASPDLVDARWLSDRLFLDVEASADQVSSRVALAMETLQGVLLAARTGIPARGAPEGDPDDGSLLLEDAHFDEVFRWLSSYAAWTAAIRVFLWPENVVLPSLRRRQTPMFAALVEELRGRPMTPRGAVEAARRYAGYFEDVCSLELEAWCQIQTRPEPVTPVTRAFHFFARSPRTGEIFWSTYTTRGGEDPSRGQTHWEGLGLAADRIIAALTFRGPSGRHFLHVFFKRNEGRGAKLMVARRDLAGTRWDPVRELTLPEPDANHGDFTAVVGQRGGFGGSLDTVFHASPHLAIRVPSGAIYDRYLDIEGNDWDAADRFRLLRKESAALHAMVATRVTRQPGDPEGMVRDVRFGLFFQKDPRGAIVCRELQAGVDVLTSTTPGSFELEMMEGDPGTWLGAFPIEVGTQNNFFETLAILALVKVGSELRYQTLHFRDEQGRFADSLQWSVKDRSGRMVDLGAIALYTGASLGLDDIRLASRRGPANARGHGDLVRSKLTARTEIVATGDLRVLLDEDELLATRMAPLFAGPFAIEPGNPAGRKAAIQAAYEANPDVSAHFAYLDEAHYFVPMFFAGLLQAGGAYREAIEWIRSVYDHTKPPADPPGERKVSYFLVRDGERDDSLFWDFSALGDDKLDPHDIASRRRNTYTRHTLITIIRCLLDFADMEFTRDTADSVARARELYATAEPLLAADELSPSRRGLPRPPARTLGDVLVAAKDPARPADPPDAPLFTAARILCVPPNPVVQELEAHAALSLRKLHQGRNVAGLARALPAYGVADPDDVRAPVAASLARTRRPTQYRYPVLVERAKQLVGIAQQIEASLLAALERRDDEAYGLLKARQDLSLTGAGVRLQDLRVQQARDGVMLAEVQKDRAEVGVEHFQGLLEEGISGLELASLGFLEGAATFQYLAGAYYLSQAAASTFSFSSLFGSGSDAIGAIAASFSTFAGALSTTSSVFSTMASYERRAEEWAFQRDAAEQDARVAAAQIVLARDHVGIAGEERRIASLQADHAGAVVDFLHNKFTNADLYAWMSNVLENVYRYFLHQATSVARLAEDQLAFERQTDVPAFILADYWEPASDGVVDAVPSARPDRRGLTGSARLLQDLYELDQFAFATDRRKLQLTKTLSLASLMPAELQRFRETGVLRFATPMELFDRDFPGHYLRLVRRVRVSMIALVPPAQGIRATLSSGGTSRVVLGGDLFPVEVMSRPPEQVALSSPREATGLVELEPQDGMLLPFEGNGVDTTWEIALPKAANPFDYDTLADVLFTVEYTALQDPDLAAQVKAKLGSTLRAERPWSFRHEFSDAWYELNNPARSKTPMKVRFATARADFPPNVDPRSIALKEVLLYFVLAPDPIDDPPVMTVTSLAFTPERTKALPAPGTITGGTASTANGLISTRSGSGSNWLKLRAAPSVFGTWELTLPDRPEVRALFADEKIKDILFVLAYEAKRPPW